MQVLHKSEERCRTGRYLRKRGHQKALQICVSFEKLRRPKLRRERQNDSRGVGGGWGGIRVENINYSIIMCDAQWEKDRRGHGRGRDRGGRARVSVVVGELCMTAMIDLWKEHTPKGYWKALNFWHGQTLRRERGRTMKKKKQKNWKQRKILFVCHRII